MKVTVCELPHEPGRLEAAWADLRAHASEHGSELVVLPELAFAPPLWLAPRFDARAWAEAAAAAERWLPRLSELGAAHVIGTRVVTSGGERSNEGFLWSADCGLAPLRRKRFLPEEPGAWEARWFSRGPAGFPPFRAGALTFGLNICTELWALESFRGYASSEVAAVVAPRATAAATTEKWLAAGVVAAVASGAYCLSSNRVEPDGSCGGVGWIIDPDGAILARTSAERPWATVDVDLERARAARSTYPRYVFAGDQGPSPSRRRG